MSLEPKSARRGPRCRKFTLLDGMILIAGLGVGLTGFRARFTEQDWWEDRTSFIEELVGVALMLTSTLMVVFRLRRPRPSLRRIARQPGALACFGAVFYDLIYNLQYFVRVVTGTSGRQTRSFGGWLWWILMTPGREFAIIVPIVWIFLLAGRRWRPEPGWIDRTGFLVGWGWIIWMIAGPLIP